ncbi:MAG: TVP38/TMEM64 family protein [Fastidiosipila sp.]|nr:TVP38/TMEM64 family protein [Fastidiosipila sp.]HPX93486.1 VTT domain-containing protein [Bacillota bacterium]
MMTAHDRSGSKVNIGHACTLYAARRRRIFQRSLTIGILILTLVASVLIYLYWGEAAIDFFSDPIKVRAMVSRHPVSSRLVFFLANFMQVVIAIIPGEPFELAAGYAFGVVEGTLICMAAIYAASILIFLLVKRFGRPVIELFFEPEKIDQVRLFRRPGQLNILLYILLFLPGTPKDILTYLAGLTPIRLSSWLIIISARLLSVVTSTVSGGLLGSQNYIYAVLVFLVTGLVALAGILMYNRLNRRAQEEEMTG